MGMIDVRRRMIASQPHRATAQGAVASFKTDMQIPLKMDFDLLPIQDLNGQANPYPPGGGKNLFNKDATPFKSSNYVLKTSVVGGQPSYNSNANYNVYRIIVNPSTTYTFGLIKANDPAWACIDENGIITQIEANNGGTNGTYITVTTGANDVAILLSVAVDGTYKCDDVLQFEAGSTHTAWTPYSNICPITGHDGFTRTGTGKNLLEVTADNLNKPSYYSATWSGTSIASGENAITVTRGNGQGGFGGIVLPTGLKAGTYRFSCEFPVVNSTKYFYYGYLRFDGTYSGQITWNTSGKNTSYTSFNLELTEDVKSIFFKMTAANDVMPLTFSKLQLEVGDTKTSYESPNIHSYETEFDTPPGTVYGGHVIDNGDGTGTLTVNRKYYDALVWSLRNSGGDKPYIRFEFSNTRYEWNPNDMLTSRKQFMCNKARTLANSGNAVPSGNLTYGLWAYDSSIVRIYLPSGSTNVEATTFMDGLTLLIKLATPVTYTLSLDAIKSLIGQNNVWVDNADSVSVNYWTH